MKWLQFQAVNFETHLPKAIKSGWNEGEVEA
jgi:hypothetical protein